VPKTYLLLALFLVFVFVVNYQCVFWFSPTRHTYTQFPKFRPFYFAPHTHTPSAHTHTRVRACTQLTNQNTSVLESAVMNELSLTVIGWHIKWNGLGTKLVGTLGAIDILVST
jgi:hypothetical protein